MKVILIILIYILITLIYILITLIITKIYFNQIDYFTTKYGYQCVTCPSNMTRSRGIGITSCKCNAGFTGPDGESCQACSEGYHKNLIGDSTCQPCREGTYNRSEGAHECISCPRNMTSPTGSDELSDCYCDIGYTTGPDGVLCQTCDNNFYKSDDLCLECINCEPGKELIDCDKDGSKGSGTCSPCLDDMWKSGTNKNRCQPKPANSRVTENRDAWFCKWGYYLNEAGTGCSSCKKCGDGKENLSCNNQGIGNGRGSCTLCRDGLYKRGRNKKLCREPPENAFATTDTTNTRFITWECYLGFYKKWGQCFPCTECGPGERLIDCIGTMNIGPGTCVPE
jgi:hypothetical protein